MVTKNLYMDIPNTSLVQQMGQVYSRVLQRELVNRHGKASRFRYTFVSIETRRHQLFSKSVVELWSLVTTFVLFVLM
jgi:hypothetical protein